MPDHVTTSVGLSFHLITANACAALPMASSYKAPDPILDAASFLQGVHPLNRSRGTSR